MFKLRYLADGQLAEISADQAYTWWPAVRRICEEAHGVRNEGNLRLTIPWWAFLSCRQALNVILSRHNIQPDFDETVRRLLREAMDRQQRYATAATSMELDWPGLERKLHENGFTRSLKIHQIRNVRKICSLPAAATFSVPGAGKTTEALAFYFAKRKPADRLLVVAPKNAFAAWEDQIKLCAPTFPHQFERLRGGQFQIAKTLNQEPMLMLVTYQQLCRVEDTVARYLSSVPNFMFLDESHRIKKGNEGRYASSVLRMSHLPRGKLILSGTPLPNELSDLVPQFDFLYPEVRATEGDVKGLIRPVYVRTTKLELDLPPMIRKLTPVTLTPGQRHLYELLKSEEARQLESLRTIDRLTLRKMGRSVMRLLQLVSNPSLLLKQEFEQQDILREVLAEGDSPKLELACQRARENAAKGLKTVIWSGFVENVEIMAARLADLKAVYIHGGVEAGSEDDEDTRERKIKQFHDDPNTWVLVGNPAACGEGISLHTVCHRAIYVDRNYNAAHYLQSEDRIHRLGLAKHVLTEVEILYATDTIDESVQRRLVEKTAEMASVLEDTSLNIEPTPFDEVEDEGLNTKDAQDVLKHFLE